jgi:hypothetical protein
MSNHMHMVNPQHPKLICAAARNAERERSEDYVLVLEVPYSGQINYTWCIHDDADEAWCGWVVQMSH